MTTGCSNRSLAGVLWGTATVACLLAVVPAVPSLADPGDPTESRSTTGANADPGSKSSGTFLDGWFGSGKPALERFERPGDNYAAIMQQRPQSLLLARSRGYGLLSEPETEEYMNEVLRKVMVAGGFGDLGVRRGEEAEPIRPADARP